MNEANTTPPTIGKRDETTQIDGLCMFEHTSVKTFSKYTEHEPIFQLCVYNNKNDQVIIKIVVVAIPLRVEVRKREQ